MKCFRYFGKHLAHSYKIKYTNPTPTCLPGEVESDVLEMYMWIFILCGSWSPKTGNNPDVLGEQERYNIVNITVHWGWGEKIKYKLLLNMFF